jgi:divalent metal cation (Fe/Co/Zn/Cd) transporter
MIDGEEASVDVKKNIEEKINTVITSINTVREYHELQIRKIDGHFFVSMHVIFSDTEKLEDVHTTASRLEYLIRQADPSIKKVLIHTEPLSDK